MTAKTPDPNQERRKYARYDTEIDIYFQVKYDITTKVEYQKVISQKHHTLSPNKHSATSKNVSAEGICFSSDAQLKVGDILHLDVYVPGSKKPIPMEGEVRWSHPLPEDDDSEHTFHTGIRLIAVKAKPVEDSIYRDESYKVIWSNVLESIFGSYKELGRKRQGPS